MNTTPLKPKPSELKQSVQTVVPPTSTPNVSAAATGSTSNSAKSKTKPEFILVIRHPQNGTLHPVLNPRAGQGVLQSFEDMEQAIAFMQSTPVCMKHECFIVGVGGE